MTATRNKARGKKATTAETTLRDVELAAHGMGLQIQVFNVSSSREINAAFATFERARPDALFVGGDGFFGARRVQLALLAALHRIPATYATREIAEAGGLMCYGSNVPDAWRQVGVYTGRILKGGIPAAKACRRVIRRIGGKSILPLPQKHCGIQSKKDERASTGPMFRLAPGTLGRSCGGLARVRLASSDSRRIIALQRNDATCQYRPSFDLRH
jgi:hypothetical protein